MDQSKICILCYNFLKDNKKIIYLSSDKSVALNIVEILKKHFEFKTIQQNNNERNLICLDCWTKTNDFNIFYNNVEYLHFIKVENDQDSGITEIKQHTKSQCKTVSNESIITIDESADITNLWMKDIHPDVHKYDSDDSDITKRMKLRKKPIKPRLRPASIRNTAKTNTKQKITKNSKLIKKGKIKVCRKPANTVSKPMNVFNTSIIDQYLLETPTRNKIGECDAKNLKEIEKKLKDEREDEQIREYFKMQCDLCERTFKKLSEAKIHYRIQHKTNGYIRCCKRKFKHRGAVMEHIIRHLNPDAYKCIVCQKSYSDKFTLQNHIRTHDPDQVTPFKCEICPKSFTKQFLLNHHKKHRHCTAADKKFVCDICEKSFISKSILTSHIKGVHQNAYSRICEVCAKIFKSKQIFEYHRKSHFSGNILQKLQCNLCGAWLTNKDSLRNHIARHKDTKHACPQCGKESANRGALRDHIRYVHKEASHICTICSKGFKHPQRLKEHMSSHTGDALYTCSYCPKSFNSGANMYTHRKKIHPMEWQADREKLKNLNNGMEVNNVI